MLFIFECTVGTQLQRHRGQELQTYQSMFETTWKMKAWEYNKTRRGEGGSTCERTQEKCVDEHNCNITPYVVWFHGGLCVIFFTNK